MTILKTALLVPLACISILRAQLTVNAFLGGAVRSGVPAEDVQLNGAHGLTHDPAGNLVFAEGHVIRRINPDGTIQTIAGTGFSGFSGDGGPATKALLSGPAIPQYDSKGNLYFIDGGTRIRRIDPSGVITTVIGTGIWGELGAKGPLAMAQISGYGMAIAPDDTLYFSDQGDIRRLTTGGSIEVVNTGTNPKCVTITGTSSQPCAPYALTFDRQGNLYFVESPGNGISSSVPSYIRRIAPDGSVTQFAGFGTSGDGASALQAAFYGISAIGVDISGNLYVAQTMDTSNLNGFILAGNKQPDSVIRRIAVSDGRVTTVAGAATAPTPLEGPAMQAYLGMVWGFAANTDGSMAFSSANTIGLLTTKSTVQLLAGRTYHPPPDGLPAAKAWLSLPLYVAIASSRTANFYFADHCVIRKVGADGLLATVAGTGNCASSMPAKYGPGIDLPPIAALAVDSHDHVFVSNGTDLYSLATDGTVSHVTGLNWAQALAFDSHNRLYVVGELGASRVDPDGTVEGLSWRPVTQWAPAPAVAVDSSDNVYLLNFYPLSSLSQVIYRFTPDGSVNAATALTFPNVPFGIDVQGGVWFVDRFASLQRGEFSALGKGGQVPDQLIQSLGDHGGYSGDGGPLVGAAFELFARSSVTSDAGGNIYVLDAGNAAIRKISGAASAKAPSVFAGGIVNAASLQGGAIASGELVSIFGSNFLGSGIQVNSPQNNVLPASIANLRVFFSGTNGSGAYGSITAATPNQINVFVPYEISGSTSVSVTVYADYVSSTAVNLPVAQSAFGLSTADASGSGQGAILNQDGSYNSDKNPAPAGSVVSLFGTGEGLTTPALPDGALVLSSPYSKPNAPVTVTIGGKPADVIYAGAAPFLPTGVLQINVQIPEGISGDATVLVSIGGISTSRKVTVAVK
ncbi:MAG TPA: hypothetical protein VFW44_14800 [Bryobacteraceae bacterium]|nr:hypothetical protein [Bryobacteraceae bacterium]